MMPFARLEHPPQVDGVPFELLGVLAVRERAWTHLEMPATTALRSLSKRSIR